VVPFGLLACSDDEGQECDPADCPFGFSCAEDGSECVPDPGFCATNNDCPLDEYCDQGRCVPFEDGATQMTCSDDSDCAPGLTCTLGLCTGCVDDLQCGPDGACVLGVCFVNPFGGGETVDRCADVTCEEGEVCVEATGECMASCTSSSQCAEEEICDPVLERCVPAVGCSSDTDCYGDADCVFGVCVGCTNDGQCRENESCLFGACVAPPDLGQLGRCDGVTCPEGQFCNPVSGECIEGTCSKDSDCPDGEFCTVLGLCASCLVDEDCEEGETCALLLGECLTDLDRLGRCRDVVCEEGQICNPFSGRCFQAGQTCESDADCEEGICNALGFCAECTVDEDCAENEFCDLTTGQCQTICSSDADCAEGEQCAVAANVCIPEFGCDSARDCNGSQGCLAGLCVGCLHNAECYADEICFFGACVPNLSAFGVCDEAQCEEDEFCNPVTGVCTAIQGCTGDDACPGDLRCNAFGQCAGCEDRSECRADEACVLGTCLPDRPFLSTPDGLCAEVECAGSRECVPNTGVCELTCVEDDECPEGEFCDPELLRCIPEAGCFDSGDCRPREICLAGLCVGCIDDSECQADEACVLGVCAQTADIDVTVCEPACEAGEICNPIAGVCVESPPFFCATDEDCQGELTCSILGLCVGCTDEVPCPEGLACVLNTCVPPPPEGGETGGGG
jgi:hypothetical protein